MVARLIIQRFAFLREKRDTVVGEILRPDAKSQVTFLYREGIPYAIDSVVLSHQTNEKYTDRETQETLKEELVCYLGQLYPQFLTKDTKFFVNPTGRFVLGGPAADCGLTGRKIIVDTYGGVGRHGGGAFSGKDPSKVDRSAAYMARKVARAIVNSGLAQKCEVQVSYAIGKAEPTSLKVDTFGTITFGREEDLVTQALLDRFAPRSIEQELSLRTWIKGDRGYSDLAGWDGHFGNSYAPWELA